MQVVKRRYPIFRVEWVDTMSWPGWRSKDDKHELVAIATVGHLIERGRKKLVLTASIDLGDEAMPYSGITVIPRSTVTKIERIDK